MARFIELEEFPQLLKSLEPHLPRCLPVYGTLQHSMDTGINHRVAVNAWPEWTAIVVYLECSYPMTTYYSTDHEDLRKLLNQPGVIDWTSLFSFLGVCKSTRAILEDAGKENGGQIESVAQFVTMVVTEDSLKQFQLPDKYLLSELTESEAELVNSEWDYNIGDKTLPLVRHMIQTGPQVCVREKLTDIPIAYEMTYYFGSMGILYVRPSHRCLGLAKATVCNLARKLLQNGRHAYCWIGVDNSVSVNLHKKCGFTVVDDYNVIEMLHTPHN